MPRICPGIAARSSPSLHRKPARDHLLTTERRVMTADTIHPKPAPAPEPRAETQRFHFTAKAIEKIPLPDEGRQHYYDTKESDLGLRVDASGRKSFFWNKFVCGRPMFRNIGKFPANDIETAREAARDLTGKLDRWKRADFTGPNPFETNGDVTFGEMFDCYVEKHLRSHANNPDKAIKADRWMVEKYLSGWSTRNVKTITAEDIRGTHRRIGAAHGKVSADRVIQMVRRVFKWSIERERMFAGPNPCIGIEFYGYKSRDRFLDGAELARLFEALSEETNADLRDFVLLSLWVGARRGDVLSMRWQDVSLADHTWRIPKPKGGKPILLPLVPETIAILKARQAIANEGATWVFPSSGKPGHLVEMKRGFAQLLKRAEISDFHIHDLRRTHGSWMAGTGATLPIIGRSLGHAPGSSATSVYARLDLEPIRKAVGVAVGAMRAASSKPTRKPKQLMLGA
jgi:integrase